MKDDGMDNDNDNIEVIVQHKGKLTIGAVGYTEYCKRKLKSEADKLKDDLVQCGYKSVVSRIDGYYVVWWAK